MIVLFVAHHIDHLVDGIVLETHLSSTDVLCHIDRSTITAEQQFLVESFVGEVGPDRVILMALEESLLKSFFHFCLTLEVGLRLVVNLIEANTQCLVGLIETSIHPGVHLLPKSADLRVILFPLHQHLMGFLDERSLLLGFLLIHALCHEFLDFLTIVLVKSNIVVTDKVVALLAGSLWCLTISPFLPSQHGLADVDTTVIDDVGFHHTVTISCLNLSQRPAKQIVAYMSEMERFVGIG